MGTGGAPADSLRLPELDGRGSAAARRHERREPIGRLQPAGSLDAGHHFSVKCRWRSEFAGEEQTGAVAALMRTLHQSDEPLHPQRPSHQQP